MFFRADLLDELNARETLEILRLRSEVFVVEQQCVYNDPDPWDDGAVHVRGFHDKHFAAYARVLAPGTRFAEASIGRVLTSPQVRGRGFGQELMRFCVQLSVQRFECTRIRISAQQYLLKFYTELGFLVDGKGYDEDGIPHVEMVYTI